MPGSVHKFRRVKWGSPAKLKVLAEDLVSRDQRLLRHLLVAFAGGAVCALAYLALT